MVHQSKLLEHAGFRHTFAGTEICTRAQLAEALGVQESSLYEVTQVHGAAVAIAGGIVSSLRSVEADAVIATAERMRAAAIRTADCVPILLGDARSGIVAAVHAGWRGVEVGVIAAALDAMPHDAEIIAAVGPHIGPCCFEVSAEVADRISAASAPQVIARSTGLKSWINLGLACELQLRARGIRHIEHVFSCTHCGEGFYSYRRDPGVGRQWSAIASQAERAR